ncbi:uncharacterized protein [Aquarana catesbeiana]|uniref:uncharacterized protein isoform X3 n=1 Tax=Aquarana catesbeiana TaxID=8400 RepID=UPI003CC95EDE
MNEIFVFLILSAMVTTGYLKTMCKRCWSLDSTECGTEKDAECDGTKCMMLSEYFNISNVIYNTVKKTCATDIMCDNCFSVSTNHGFKLRSSGECREGDNSNAELEYKDGKEVPMSMQGCITEGGCKMGDGVVLGAKQLEAIEKTCTPAIPVDPAR